MRYFRMYVVVSMLMAGGIRAAEAPAIEGGTTTGEEEPPQELAASADGTATTDQSPEDEHEGESVKEAPPVVAQEEPMGSLETAAPTEPVAEPLEKEVSEVSAAPASPASIAPNDETAAVQAEEPTIEDAEQIIEEHGGGTDSLGALPPQPGSIPGVLPDEPKEQESIPESSNLAEKPQGISTVDLEHPQGNWLFKRYWWERAEELYKKMRTNVEKINDLRVKFFARRTELDKTILDPFYADIGLAQSELQAAMQALMTQLEREREKEGTLSDEEREMMLTMQKDRERLEQLQRDVNEVGILRDAADKVVDRVMDQKNRAARYESEAWDAMREIGRIVSDTQASELYYRMDAGWRTMKTIYNYIDQDLTRYFDQLLVNAQEQTERIKTALQALKEQGVDLKQHMQQMQEHEVQQELAQTEGEEKEKKAAVPAKTGWFSATSRLFQAVIDVALWQFLQSIWDAIMWLPRRIYSTITSLFR